jgi:hypothetical protein
MADNPIDRRFAIIADHLESLAASIQNVEDLQAQDRLRLEQDSLRMDRLERLFKLMIRLGDRERKELRERINALIDAQILSEDKMQELSATQARSQEAAAVFQAQVGVVLEKLADATSLAHRRLDALEAKADS